MIGKQTIEGILEPLKEKLGFFVVDVTIDRSNKIRVLIDRNDGIRVEDCVKISREIEGMLDRDEEDFALEVSSPGLDSPFRVPEQYEKNKGKEVEVTLTDGKKMTGVLIDTSEQGIEMEYIEKVIVPGKKKKVTEKKQISLGFDDIKTTKKVINFK